MTRITEDQLKALQERRGAVLSLGATNPAPPQSTLPASTGRRHKYGAKPVVIDNIRFDSQAEGKRYSELKLLERAGKIGSLTRQTRFPFELKGKVMFIYYADFSYFEDGKLVVEDVKGMKTAVYRLKRRLIEAAYEISIVEIPA